MATFRIKMSLSNFQLEVEGTREDVPLITHNIGQQFAGLMAPAVGIVEGEIVEQSQDGVSRPISLPSSGENGAPQKRKSARKRKASAGSESTDSKAEAAPLNWRHDTAKWGTPAKDWSLGKKVLWLMFVAGNETQTQDLTASGIVATFNKHFRQAGDIETRYVTRELGRMKGSEERARFRRLHA